MQSGVGLPDGVVLKVVRNGQYEEKATKIDLLKEIVNVKPVLKGDKLTAPAYNYRIQQSQVIVADVFK